MGGADYEALYRKAGKKIEIIIVFVFISVDPLD